MLNESLSVGGDDVLVCLAGLLMGMGWAADTGRESRRRIWRQGAATRPWAAGTAWNTRSWRGREEPSLPADRLECFCLRESWGMGEMAVESARIAEVWHHFQVDVMFITFCSRALAGADKCITSWQRPGALLLGARVTQ